MAEISLDRLDERTAHILEHVKQISDIDIPEMKQDIKITRDQALKTNGRVNRHDEEIKDLHGIAKQYLEDKKKEEQNKLSVYEKRWQKIKDIGFRWGVAVVIGIATANQLPDLVVKFIKLFASIWMKN